MNSSDKYKLSCSGCRKVIGGQFDDGCRWSQGCYRDRDSIECPWCRGVTKWPEEWTREREAKHEQRDAARRSLGRLGVGEY